MKSVGQATAQLVSVQLFGRFKDTTAPGRERLAQFAEVSDDAERALRERIQQRQLTQAHRTRTVPNSAGRGSVFQHLGSRPDPPAGGEEFQVCPEMTPQKIQWGRQPSRGSETSEKQTSHSLSGQKRRSASRSRDQVDPKKGKTDARTAGTADGRDRKVLVGINWQTTTIEEPAPKTSSQHPSFKPDRTGASKSPPEPKIKSAVMSLRDLLPSSQSPQSHQGTIARHQHSLPRRRTTNP